jgi:hypothetical protein
MTRRTPCYIVCSPRPRVGKTLVARLAAEFFRDDAGAVRAFDLNSNEPSLVDYLPALTAMADIEATLGQVAVLDHLIVNDGVPKVVDLGGSLFERFFHLLEEIQLPQEQRRQAVEPVVLFMVDQDRSAARAYATLQGRFPEITLVPVYNEGITTLYQDSEDFPEGPGGVLRIRPLPAVVRGVIDKPGFSFSDFLARQADRPTTLHGWVRNAFVELRELELRLLLKTLGSSLQIKA